MENASKALLMAAAMLMTVLVLSLGIFWYASFQDSSKRIQEQIEIDHLTEFNDQFLAYSGIDCTIYDILNLVNLADDYNSRNNNKSGDSYYLTISIGGNSQNNYDSGVYHNNGLTYSKIQSNLDTDYSTKEDNGFGPEFKLKRYETVEIEYSDLTGRIKLMKFNVKT